MKNQMKMMFSVALLGGLFLLGGCNKNEFGNAGKLIKFGTRSEMTKTEYAGKDNDANNIEPIWWKEGDKVRIVSNNAIVTNTTDQKYSDYQFKDFVDGDKSHATVTNVGTNGLAWVDGVETYNFYAVYPSTINIGSEVNLGLIQAEIPSTQAVVAHEYDASDTGNAKEWYNVVNGKYTVYAIMTAKKENAKESEGKVDLTFYPAFTAFEFTFESADPEVDINLTAFRMESTSTALSGIFTGNAGSRSFSPVETSKYTVSLTNPGAIGTIESGEPKSFTIFAMPQKLTDLSVYFTDKDNDGIERTRVLKLNYSTNIDEETGQPYAGDNAGKPIEFEAGHKYRIRGLKLPGNQYQFFLTLNGIVQEWIVSSAETLFSDQIQCSALTFDKSAREMTDAYKSEHDGKTNNYKDSPIGDGRWQVRTLNNQGLDGETHSYFNVTFTPTAPLGGYWRLDTHENPYWTIQVVGKPGALDEEISELPREGRIMNQKITLRITPNIAAINDAPASTEIGLYFDCYFATNIDFDPALNANTEFQDIHGAGTYSYWLLTYERQQ